jgi:ABC-type Fe3+ transport system permease subunit
MSVAHQMVDVLVSGLIAGLSSFLLSAFAPQLAVTIGVILASMYYFSRNPWGSQNGDAINDQVDELYDRYLPF